MNSDEELSFAYKYPFTSEAKAVVAAQGSAPEQGMDKFLEMARARVEESFRKGTLEYKNMRYGRADYLVSYVYARMLVSALGSRLGVSKYATAEAARSKEALESGDNGDIVHVAKELGLKVAVADDSFKVAFAQFTEKMAGYPDFSLSNFGMHNGHVVLDRHEMAEALRFFITAEITKGLPIKLSDIPQRVVAIAKSIKPPQAQPSGSIQRKGTFAWVEKLLGTPIPDVRHRTVNLVLAPYLVNTKGLSEEEAAKVISEYIDRCKELDPNTNITDSYIRYQCSYAKRRGLKPLSLARARELLGGFLDLGEPRVGR